MIIGFTGAKRCGKDTAASYVLKKFKHSSQLMLADPIKRGLMAMFGFTWEQVNGHNGYDREQIEEPYGVSIRYMLQTLGTEWGRKLINNDVWLHRQYVKMSEDPHTIYVMSDVRFGNEAEFCRKYGTLVHVEATTPWGAEYDAHESEAGIPFKEGDHLIKNSKDGMEKYHDAVDAVLIKIFTERGEA